MVQQHRSAAPHSLEGTLPALAVQRVEDVVDAARFDFCEAAAFDDRLNARRRGKAYTLPVWVPALQQHKPLGALHVRSILRQDRLCSHDTVLPVIRKPVVREPRW